MPYHCNLIIFERVLNNYENLSELDLPRKSQIRLKFLAKSLLTDLDL
jgi:hypothetical protein